MLDFSANLLSKGLPTTIDCEADLDQLLTSLEQDVKDLKLWQYYVLDSSRERSSVASALKSRNICPWVGPEVRGKSVVELAGILRSEETIIGLSLLASRFGVHIKGDVAAGFIKAAFVELQAIDALADMWVKIIDIINVPLYEEWEDDARVALSNIRNRARYTRLDAHGPKLGEITKQ